MKNIQFLSKYKGDISGGISASLMTLPKGMAFGALIFAPLGPEHIPTGIVAGIISLFISNLLVAPMGSVKIMSTSPYSLSSIMLLSVMTFIIVKIKSISGFQADVATILSLFFLTIFMAGLFQALFGLFKIGDLAKYIPYPVLSGLLVGSSVVIFLSQVESMLGLEELDSILKLPSELPNVKLLTLLVGLITCLAIWAGPKFSKKIAAPFYGIFAGSAAYYLLQSLGFEKSLGAVVGEIPSGLPKPEYAIIFFELISTTELLDLITSLIPLALGIAALVTLRTMITGVTADFLTQDRSDLNQELIGQGIGNMFTAFFGGITSAGSISSTLGNYKYGARSSFSRIVSGLFALAVLLFLHPWVAKLPKAVLAGLLVVIAISTFDKWVLTLIANLRKHNMAYRSEILVNFFVVVLVSTLLLSYGIFIAIGAGLVFSIVFFVLRMGKQVIRREYGGDQVFSNISRREKEINLLEREGDKIRIFELEGALFFGTSDKVFSEVDKHLRGEAIYIVLDFKRITDIDSTGAMILKKLKEKCEKQKKHLLFSSINDDASIHKFPELSSILNSEDSCFSSTEEAIGWAEDKLLNQKLGLDRYKEEIPLDEVDALKSLSEEEIEYLKKYMRKESYEKGTPVFSQGDDKREIFFVVRGRAQVNFKSSSDARNQQFGKLCAGTLFGEMAIFDDQKRSASIMAEEPLTCHCLSIDTLEEINRNNPPLAYKILAGVSKELSIRMRISNKIMAQLKL